MLRVVRTLSRGLLAMLLAGCATQTVTPAKPVNEGSASYRALDDGHMAHYQLAMGEVSSGATPFKRVAPVYPPDQLNVCAPSVEVKALLIVNESGMVEEVRVADEAQAGSARREFIAATRAAAMQWRFTPLLIGHWAADANGNSHTVDSRARPFSLAYAFHFNCREGKPATSVNGG